MQQSERRNSRSQGHGMTLTSDFSFSRVRPTQDNSDQRHSLRYDSSRLSDERAKKEYTSACKHI